MIEFLHPTGPLVPGERGSDGQAARASQVQVKAVKIPYRVPAEAELPERLGSVLAALYLIYNAGLDGPDRSSLRDEAIRLARSLVGLVPNEPETAGCSPCCCSVSHGRRRGTWAARSCSCDQDRSRWNRAMIREGRAIVRACIRRGRLGPYQLQAAIQAVHCAAESFETTDWPQIVALYDQLYPILPTPVVALRAIAIGEVEGPSATLATLDAIAPDVDGYHLLHEWHDAAQARPRGCRSGRVRTRRRPRADERRPAVPRTTDGGVGLRLSST